MRDVMTIFGKYNLQQSRQYSKESSIKKKVLTKLDKLDSGFKPSTTKKGEKFRAGN